MDNLLLLLKAVILGIVEGITEFLPVSSTGHMILVGAFLGTDKGAYAQFFKLFEISIQFGAILAVVVLYRRRIVDVFRHLGRGQYGLRLTLGIIAALVPTVIVAKLLYKKIGDLLMIPLPVALSLVVGGIALIYCERAFSKNRKIKRMEDVGVKEGFVIGLFQCISFLWPGFSRSASTIIGGWVIGLTTVAAADFTFFLAIPTMFGATAYSLLDAKMQLTGIEIAALIVGFVVAFLVALIVVKKFIGFLKHKPLRVFGYYRIIVGVLMLLCVAVGILH
ncbi:undecaprenyl-diphosphate phosphatase [Ethanoligenens sp.]|uniref:undecaprenyl-diphosphate phosphatase n=1 Tax=Ethanoligenens sp. TaxID=2099655 RepID=UPI0039E8C98B